MPAPSRLVLHQTNQVFLDDSRGRDDNARLAAREISAAAAVGAVAGVRAAITEDGQVNSEMVAKAATAAASAARSNDQRDIKTKPVVVTVATAAPGDAAAEKSSTAEDAKLTTCNPKVPTGVTKRPQPNPCPWWGAMHDKFVQQIQVPQSSTPSSCLAVSLNVTVDPFHHRPAAISSLHECIGGANKDTQ